MKTNDFINYIFRVFALLYCSFFVHSCNESSIEQSKRCGWCFREINPWIPEMIGRTGCSDDGLITEYCPLGGIVTIYSRSASKSFHLQFQDGVVRTKFSYIEGGCEHHCYVQLNGAEVVIYDYCDNPFLDEGPYLESIEIIKEERYDFFAFDQEVLFRIMPMSDFQILKDSVKIHNEYLFSFEENQIIVKWNQRMRNDNGWDSRLVSTSEYPISVRSEFGIRFRFGLLN